MRFGRNLHRWQVPSWADSYVNYSYLKGLVKKKPTVTILNRAIELEINAADDFLSRQNNLIELQIETLNKNWGIEIGCAQSPYYHDVSKHELRALTSLLQDFAHDVAQYHLFAKANHDAISRILNKAVAIYGFEKPCNVALLSRLDDWCHSLISCLVQLNNTLRAVGSATKREELAVTPRSLLLERYGQNRFPPETIRCLAEDNDILLDASLKRQYPSISTDRSLALSQLAQIATIHQSIRCQGVFLASPKFDPDQDIVVYKDLLHQIIQSLARFQRYRDDSSATKAFARVLELLGPGHRFLLCTKDRLGRLPLHDAARLGLDGVCREMIAAIRAQPSETWKQKLYVLPDVFGLTPLDYAVQLGHTTVVELLFTELSFKHLSNEQRVDISGTLATAVRSGFIDISRRLIHEAWGFRFVSRFGQTVLHLAAERGLSVLVESLVALGVDVNARGDARGWTPISTACVQGHTETVEVLLQAGAEANIEDQRGWFAQDHAAYRGHMQVLKAFSIRGSSFLSDKYGAYHSKLNVLPQRSPTDSIIFMYLGTLNLFKRAAGVDITQYRRSISPVLIPDTCLDLSISLSGVPDQGHTISFPVIPEASDQPWCFTVSDPDNATIMFKVTSPLEDKPIGIAVALLNALKQGLGANRESLVRDFTLPLISDNHDYVRTVVFTFVVARPLSLQKQAPTEAQVLELGKGSSLGGHRGTDLCVMSSRSHVDLVEQSFQTAVEHGADVVEFGCNPPMHTLTLEQFMDVNNALSTIQCLNDILERLPWEQSDRPRAATNLRRNSLGALRDMATKALISQMEHTLDYPRFKSYLRGHSIHEPFITLEMLLCNLSEDVPLDIELKYPMLYEAEDFQMDAFAFDINHFLDKILYVIYSFAGPWRRIIFSSFSPEICIVLVAKQQPYPVLFLNDASNCMTGDMRATSLQTAVRFAYRFGLAGVAMASEPFIASPGLAGFVRRQGLYTATYGPLNDDAEGLELQAKAGIDLIVVNKVKHARQVLSHVQGLRMQPESS
ncbi:ankyrin repeat-containing protein [Fusarium tjaetaba]|uniref:Ankyrin repeat-containing protein n=1 Tax=Fusarium tjaetaba TaxID=1567544 RepID=A0A8H5W6D4_9HYPO|nr:ankyrin repeat-containing protein [Fusarium tjaetaba]KAF5646624.1 ankyrin repeat-containing protein [Fusarium tjaetaba]